MANISAASLERLQDLISWAFLMWMSFQSSARQIESNFVVEALVTDGEIEKLRGEGFQVMVLSNADRLGNQRKREVG